MGFRNQQNKEANGGSLVDAQTESAKHILGKRGLHLCKKQFSVNKNQNITTIVMYLSYTFQIFVF